MESLLSVVVLTSIFCCLVGMLFLYGKITRYKAERDPRMNRLILQDWLNVHDVRLPSANELIKEMNIQSSHITPVKIGEVSGSRHMICMHCVFIMTYVMCVCNIVIVNRILI